MFPTQGSWIRHPAWKSRIQGLGSCPRVHGPRFCPRAEIAGLFHFFIIIIIIINNLFKVDDKKNLQAVNLLQ